jgi:hypothetical protein
MPAQKYYLIIFASVVVYLLVPFRSLNVDRATTIGLPDMPGVGVSLTASYGVVSLRKDDGTFEDVGCVERDADYAKMIERLSAPEAQRARQVHNFTLFVVLLIGRLYSALRILPWRSSGKTGRDSYFAAHASALGSQHQAM